MAAELSELEQQYRDAVLDDVIPFWQRHSLDRECGGYFTCLDRDGSVYDTDKFAWLQARQVWMFAALYNRVEQRDDWLDVATLGADFLRQHGADGDLNWYFALTRGGRPLVQPYTLPSDCFGAIGMAQYAVAAGDDEAYGERFSHLHRRGERLLEVEGGPWKGCFHVPRALYTCWKEFPALARDNDPPE